MLFFGYKVTLLSMPLYAVFCAILSLCVVILFAVAKEKDLPVRIKRLLSLLAPISAYNALICVRADRSGWVIAGMCICVLIYCYLTVRYTTPFAKCFALTASGLLVFVTCSVVFVGALFSGFSEETVALSVTSPNGTYRAEAICRDEGALGADTAVDVYENKGVDAFLFKVSKKPKRIYQSGENTWEDSELYWQSDSCLVIRSVAYEIQP